VKLFAKRTADKAVNRLEELFLAAANDASARPLFYREFLKFGLYFLGEAVGPSVNLGRGYHESLGQELRFRGYNIGGKIVAAIFSSEERIRETLDDPKALKKANYLRMNARSLLESLPPGTPVVLNPRSSFGKEFAPEEVKAILDGSIFGKRKEGTLIPPGEQYYLRKPPNLPEKLILALTAYFRRSDVIREAYVAEIYVPSSGDPPHLVLGVGLVPNPDRRLEDIVAEIDIIAKSVMGPKEFLDVIEMRAGKIEEFMRHETVALYTK
jgi:hypothetical protein